MAGSHAHRWQPIANLPDDWRTALLNPQTTAMVQVWQDHAGELREKELYKLFLARLLREWAIETGVIEGLYTLSEGATQALIEKGLDAALIAHEDTNDDPKSVMAKIQDQHHAIQGLYQFVSGERPLGTSYIKELHQVLTAHQETYLGRDQFGNWHRIKLPRGIWKTQPNNVEHPDGTGFEYCPPEHVDQEMDHLIRWHLQHAEQGVPPDIEAAWLHHRFTLIHPFTDGNGRVARCLATLVLLKAHWLPLVVTRHERSDYIQALRAADDGKLKPLVDLFGDLQRKSIRQALSLSSVVVHDAENLDPLLQSAKEKLSRSRQPRPQRIQQAFWIADSLHLLSRKRLEDVAEKVQLVVSAERGNYRAFVDDAMNRSPFSRFDMHQMAMIGESKWTQTPNRYQAWIALHIHTHHKTRLLFLFHEFGEEDVGVLQCTGLVSMMLQDGTIEERPAEMEFLSDEPFEFTYLEAQEEVELRFRKWLDECIVKGLDYWQKSL